MDNKLTIEEIRECGRLLAVSDETRKVKQENCSHPMKYWLETFPVGPGFVERKCKLCNAILLLVFVGR